MPEITSTRPARRGAAITLLLLALSGCGGEGQEASTVRPAAGLSPSVPVPDDPTTTTTTTTEPPPITAPPTTSPAGSVDGRRSATRLTEPTPATTAKPASTPTTVARPVTTSTTTPAPADPPAAGPGTVVSHGGPVRDHVSLVDNLRGRGLTVVPESSVSQPFLRGEGTVLAISGAGVARTSIQSFEYGSAEAAAADAATFDANGNPRGTVVSWIGPPHLYQRGRVLVIYVGSDTALTGVLAELLGPQFSGR